MNEIKMFEIDPKLFVTCRLCLESMGVYQIVPSVQKQIKFCYEIEVDPFDGLPQLICRDCESTLRTYFEVKTNYIEKQKDLRERLQLQNVTSHSSAIQHKQETVNSTQVLGSEGNSNNRKRITNFRDSLSDTSDMDCSVKSREKRKNRSKHTKDPDTVNIFELGYTKSFICRFCNHQCRYKSKIIRHIDTHSSMKQQYVNLINRDCYVKLDKMDNKPNIFKSERYIVHNSKKITHSVHKFYYVLISPKEKTKTRCDRTSPEVKDIFGSDSDDGVIIKGCKNRRRKHRILSNDTVIIEKSDLDSSMLDDTLTHEVTSRSNASTINDNECISIDDSDTESFKSSHIVTNAGSSNSTSSVNNSENKTIHNIISLCFKRHLKRLGSIDTIEADIPYTVRPQATKLDSLLKHKVLSIGKKMINNSAFSCTGILRYLEHQNLEIVWTPKIFKHFGKKSDCVKIMMKLKRHDENDGEVGWNILENTDQVNETSNDFSVSPTENELIQNIDKMCNNRSEKDSVTENHADNTEDRAVLYSDNVGPNKDTILKKILNENPVPNPKALPKKTQVPNLSINKKKRTISKEDKSISVDTQNVEITDNMLLPVITSTISLASTGDAEEQQPAHNNLPSVLSTAIAEQSNDVSTIPLIEKATMNSEQEPVVANFPKIKVKPVAQLMSNTALNIMEQQYIPPANMFAHSQNINTVYQNNSNIVNTNTVPILRLNNMTGYQNNNVMSQSLFQTNPATNMSMLHENNTRENVVMHSVDLPNAKTTSPFGYLQRLLKIHNIHLLSPDEIMSADFICLLKFKLIFQQETTSPLALCLALFNLKDKFCLKVKDVNDVDINITRLQPVWQWEILKVYSGDVANKMLINAQKVSSEVYENTHKFLCYLNSIEFNKNV